MISKDTLCSISNAFKDFSLTKATIKNKDYMWQVYIDFCNLYDEDPISSSGELLVKYSVYLIIQRSCSIPTVKNHLSVIKRHLKMSYDLEVPSPSQYLPLLATLKGGSKYIGRNTKQKFPVMANLLSALTLSLPKDSPYKTAYNLFFFGLPRVGNILPPKTDNFDVIKHLTLK